MRPSSTETQGFSLVDLLIVAAILAILAAVAIPNLLNAQTRSLVARAKSDMKVIATAMDAYMIDWRSYPPRRAVGLGLVVLTTPVAYVSKLPIDPFPPEGASPSLYGMCSGGSKALPTSDCAGDTNDNFVPWPKDMFILFSDGPDLGPRFNSQRFPHRHTSGPSSGVRVYDASNGSASDGDIFRWICPARYNVVFEIGYDPAYGIDPTNGAYERWRTGGV